MMRLCKYDISLRLILIYHDKNISLCQLSQSGVAVVRDKSPEAINMIFSNNLLLKETTNVMTINYPLGQKNIKLTTGIVL